MKKSKVLQLNNAYIQDEIHKERIRQEENRQKNRFMGMLLVLIVFLFTLPAYNLVESYHRLQEKEAQLAELEAQYQDLSEQQQLAASLVRKLEDEEYAKKYVRARLQYSKEGEIVYNIPGLLPQ